MVLLLIEAELFKKNHIDIFNGTEAGKYFKGGTSNNTQFEIVSVGSGKNFWK